MRDIELHKQIKLFCEESFEYVTRLVSKLGDKAPTRIAEKFLIVDDHTTSHYQDTVIDWSRLIFNIEKDLQKFDSYKKATNSLNNHEIFGKQLNTLVGTSSSMRRLDTNEFLLQFFLISLLIESDKTVFEEEKFKRLYENTENWFYSETLRIRYFAPISNFSMEQDRLELDPGFAIIRIKKKEKEKLMSTSSAFHSTFQILTSKEYAFEFIAEQKKCIGERTKNAEEGLNPEKTAKSWFRNACFALRLFKSGLIGFNHIWIIDTNWDFSGIQSTSSNLGPSEYMGDHMTISVKEVPAFLELWQRYKKISQRRLKKILNSIARLNFGTERNRHEDKLIDYFVAFESLFLSKKDPELRYRLSLLTSHWVGSTSSERKKIFRIIKIGYDQRSTIVHGGDPEQLISFDGANITFAEHTKLVEDYLRLSIKKFIAECADNNKNEVQLVEELQDRILE